MHTNPADYSTWITKTASRYIARSFNNGSDRPHRCRYTYGSVHVLSCWPDGLELTPGFYPGSNEQHRLF